MQAVQHCDVVIVGGGIAGASLAANLAPRCSVTLIERETMLAQHSTGRSAAAFLESYGTDAIRALTRASRHELEHAPEDGETPALLTPRALVWIARPDQLHELDHFLDTVPSLERLDEHAVRRACPRLRPGYAAAGALEAEAADMDVLAIHGRFMRLARAAGARVQVGTRLDAAERRGDGWALRIEGGHEIQAPVLVNAAGAWADVVATGCGLAPIGLQPMRRTIAIGRSKAGPVEPGDPLAGDVGEEFYFKPEGPNVLVSPADETPSAPCDARPQEEDVALAIDRVNAATTYDIRSVVTTWSGLRTFAPDRNLVVGWAPGHDGVLLARRPGGLRHPDLARPRPARCRTGARRRSPDRHRRPGPEARQDRSRPLRRRTVNGPRIASGRPLDERWC